MREMKTYASPQVIFAVWFFIAAFVFGNIRTVKAEEPLSVEGTWEVMSVSSETEKSLIGNRVSISRKGDNYEVKGAFDNRPWIWSGNDKQVVHTEMELLHDPTNATESGKPLPPVVARKFAGQRIPISCSYTLSADGNFLTREQDSKSFYWQSNPGTGEVRNVRYVLEPGLFKRTLKRVSQVVSIKKTLTSAVAQVESRGEFYFLTKDGRKLTGREAEQIPLEEGTKVVTGSNGHIRLRLPDDTSFTLGPNSDMVLDKFVYDSDNTPKTIMVDLSKGVFRWVTGKVKPLNDPAEMKVKLAVGYLGIRGTDFEVAVNSDGSGSVSLHFGQLAITERKTGFTFMLDAGYKVTLGTDGSISRPMKSE